MTQVKLLIIRHGEREDEAFNDAFYRYQEREWNMNKSKNKNKTFEEALADGSIPPPPHQDTLDPLLTLRGYTQANHSFYALMKTLGERRVATFSSPLRRAIGTALMVGSVASHESVSWPQPNSTNSNHKDDSIPITVLNGLGDFASRVYSYGGYAALVPTGSIRCADMASNDGTRSSPLVQSIGMMPSYKVDCPSASQSVRFWKCSAGIERYEFVPMSPTIDPSTKFFHKKEEMLTHCVYPLPPRKNYRPKAPRYPPMNAVDEAIRLTIARGCDTCIIVAHRETIRDLVELCGYYGRIRAPYCCIGSFNAIYERNRGIKYQLSNVWAPNDFWKHSPERIPAWSSGVSNVIFLIPGVTDQLICSVDSRLDNGILGPHIWLSTNEDSRIRCEDYHKYRCTYLTLPIHHGRTLWGRYLALLEGRYNEDPGNIKSNITEAIRNKGHCRLYGWATWILSNGERRMLNISVSPRRNAALHESITLKVFY